MCEFWVNKLERPAARHSGPGNSFNWQHSKSPGAAWAPSSLCSHRAHRARLNCWIKHSHSPIQIFVTAVPRTEVKCRCHNCVNWCVMGQSITAERGPGGHSLPFLSQHRFDSVKCVLLLQTWHFKRFGQCNPLPLLLGIYSSSLITHGQETSHQIFPWFHMIPLMTLPASSFATASPFTHLGFPPSLQVQEPA